MQSQCIGQSISTRLEQFTALPLIGHSIRSTKKALQKERRTSCAQELTGKPEHEGWTHAEHVGKEKMASRIQNLQYVFLGCSSRCKN